jgi:hypothetical protein
MIALSAFLALFLCGLAVALVVATGWQLAAEYAERQRRAGAWSWHVPGTARA